jgi:hypothetical protein
MGKKDEKCIECGANIWSELQDEALTREEERANVLRLLRSIARGHCTTLHNGEEKLWEEIVEILKPWMYGGENYQHAQKEARHHTLEEVLTLCRKVEESAREHYGVSESVGASMVANRVKNIMSMKTIDDEAWMHAACLSIAEGLPGWDREWNEDGHSEAMRAVHSLRKEMMQAEEKLKVTQVKLEAAEAKIGMLEEVAKRGLHWSDCYGARFPSSGAIADTEDGTIIMANITTESKARDCRLSAEALRDVAKRWSGDHYLWPTHEIVRLLEGRANAIEETGERILAGRAIRPNPLREFARDMERLAKAARKENDPMTAMACEFAELAALKTIKTKEGSKDD